LNSTDFIASMIKTNFTGRPDLALTYYPSVYNFLWYSSRTLFLLNSQFAKYDYLKSCDEEELIKNSEFMVNFKKLEPIYNQVKETLEDAFENTVTNDLNKWKRVDEKKQFYYCDFLGLNDTNIFGKPDPHEDDCLFSTAQAINILIATWTKQEASQRKGLIWHSNTPDNVKVLVESSVQWLRDNVFDKKFKPMNAFFSGSVKGSDTLPFYFPVNYAEYLNGTVIDPNQDYSDMNSLFAGVKGTIDKNLYQKLILVEHYNRTTPVDFHGFNVDGGGSPFWSSEPYTYAVSLLALSQYNNLIN
jgi:hypothetical protein